jgi:signal transduction histidine kinase
MNVVRRAPTLRRTLVAITALVTVLSLAIAALLVSLTTYLQRVTSDLASSVESVRLAEEIEIDLLLHLRAHDPLARRKFEADLRRKLLDARPFATTPEEAVLLQRAGSLAEAYVAASRAPEPSASDLEARADEAFGALEDLVTMNVEQSQAAYAASSRWEAVANTLGISFSAMLLALAGWLIWWLKARAFPPVLALGQAMDRFAAGDRGARATESGPEELREMARRFNDMAAALAAQREAQIAFLGGVAHDLRNPLSVLKMSTALVEPGRPLPPEQAMRRTLDIVSRQVSRMDRMVGDFLDMANIEAGKLELRFQEQDACLLLRRVVELFESASPKHDLSISTPDAAVPLRCDPLRIEQVVTNLISNAIKYSPDGGVVRISLQVVREEAVIEVRDRGIGIARGDQRRLFEPFRRLHRSREAIPGVGLGLFVVHRIVEAHRGRIDVESTVGEGSTFRVVLPLGDGAADPDVRSRLEGPADAP